MSNSIDLKKNNQNKVYRYIYENDGPVSKYELMEQLDLSLPTVNLILKHLTAEHYILEKGTFHSQGGRPPKAFTYNPSLYYSIGLDITAHHVHSALIDLSGQIIAKRKERREFQSDKAYYNFLRAQTDGLIREACIDRRQVLGAGVALPVMVDMGNQTPLHSDMTLFHLAALENFEKYLDLPCILCNDANAGGLAENWKIKGTRNTFYLSLNNTIGGAILNNNRLYWGETYEGGEIGHVTLVNDGRLCYCGKKGCVDAYLSALLLSDQAEGSLDRFFQYLHARSEKHMAVWREYLEYLTITVNNLKMLFDCPIIAGGYVGAYLEEYLEQIRDMLSRRNTYHENADYFRVCRYKRFSTAVGAALLNVEMFLSKV